MKSLLSAVGIVLGVELALAAVFVYSGIYNVAADAPHWGITSLLMDTQRTRSIERRAKNVTVPDLSDQQLVLRGAGQYAAMCASCHLAPGLKPNEISSGLYPAPPDLSQQRLDPRVSFIVIKHGIKMTGMPAWGGLHGDEQVWSLVAFLAKLPDLTPEQYQQYIRSPAAKTAAAMESHGAAMTPQQSASSPAARSEPMHGPPGHHGSKANDKHR